MKEESKIKSFVLKTISMIINDKIMSRIFYKFGGLSVGFLRAQLRCCFIFLATKPRIFIYCNGLNMILKH